MFRYTPYPFFSPSSQLPSQTLPELQVYLPCPWYSPLRKSPSQVWVLDLNTPQPQNLPFRNSPQNSLPFSKRIFPWPFLRLLWNCPSQTYWPIFCSRPCPSKRWSRNSPSQISFPFGDTNLPFCSSLFLNIPEQVAWFCWKTPNPHALSFSQAPQQNPPCGHSILPCPCLADPNISPTQTSPVSYLILNLLLGSGQMLELTGGACPALEMLTVKGVLEDAERGLLSVFWEKVQHSLQSSVLPIVLKDKSEVLIWIILLWAGNMSGGDIRGNRVDQVVLFVAKADIGVNSAAISLIQQLCYLLPILSSIFPLIFHYFAHIPRCVDQGWAGVVFVIILKMLQSKQLQKLLDIMSLKEQTLDEIEGQFLTSFNESMSVFNASFAISNLLNLNLLNSQQRIVALFLLIENFKSEGIKRHPFGATILNISQKTNQPYERRMIAELVVDSKRDKYSKIKIELLNEEAQGLIDMIEERPEIKKMRDEFIASLPKISQNKRSEVHAVVSDFNERDKKYFAPETEVNRATIKEQEVSNDGFNIGFMRPIPAFLDISPSEFNWLSPGIVTDVHWDNTAQIEKKLQKCRQIINKGLDHHLTKDQATEIDRSLEIQPYAVLSLNISCENLNLLIKNNPFVAVSFLVKMANYPLIAEYLQSILLSPISLNSIDVISRLTKVARIPNEYLQTYTLKNMKQAMAIPQNHKDRGKLPRVIATFIRSLMKNKVLDISKYEEELMDFMNAFVEIEEIQNLRRALNLKHE